MPTSKKIIIDGEEVEPISKVKLPPKIDWQARVLEKRQEAIAKAEAGAKDDES